MGSIPHPCTILAMYFQWLLLLLLLLLIAPAAIATAVTGDVMVAAVADVADAVTASVSDMLQLEVLLLIWPLFAECQWLGSGHYSTTGWGWWIFPRAGNF